MIKSKKIAVLMMAIAVLCSFFFTGCKNVNVDEEITINNCNESAVKVAEGFLQSVFTENEDLFYKCFPDCAFEEGDKAFEAYIAGNADAGKFIGCKYVNFNDYNEDNGYNQEWMKTNISLMHNVEEDDIQKIQIVKIDVCFEGANKKEYNSVSAYVLVYQLNDNNWYALEIQNSDAEFAA